MDYRLTKRAFDDLTDGTFNRRQVERILQALDILSKSSCPEAEYNVCPLAFTGGQSYRMKIMNDVVNARVCFEIRNDRGLIVVWGVFPRCENTYIWAEIRRDVMELGR